MNNSEKNIATDSATRAHFLWMFPVYSSDILTCYIKTSSRKRMNVLTALKIRKKKPSGALTY